MDKRALKIPKPIDQPEADIRSSEPLPEPNNFGDEKMSARVDLRSYLIDQGYKDLVQIRIIESLIQKQSLAIDLIPEIVHSSKDKKIGLTEELIFRGLIEEGDVVAVSAEINNIDPVILKEIKIEPEQAYLINFDEATRWGVLPYGRNDLGHLLVAIADLENIQAREDVQKRLAEETIDFKLAGANDLAIFIDKTYNSESTEAIESLVLEAEQENGSALTDTLHARETDYSAPIIRLVNEIIRGAVVEGASDVHIESHQDYAMVRYRVDSLLRDIRKIQKNLEPKVISRIKNIANMKPDERKTPQDGRVSLPVEGREIDLRVATLPVVHGEQATMRLLDSTQAMVDLTKLGMSEENMKRYLQAIKKPHGCCFITGPTGSGKSTTLYSSLYQIKDSQKKIMTLEDPVEYRLEGISQTDLSGGVRTDDGSKMSFATVLKSILRSDPDIIMVGEIRDEETAKISIDASLTGHFLYSTLHTNDALSSITRLERMGIERFLIAAATEVIVAQRLIRKLCQCRIRATLNEDYFLSNDFSPSLEKKIRELDKKDRVIYRPSPDGCVECAGTGYKGRTAVHEVVLMDPAIRHAIESNVTLEELEAITRELGFGSLIDDAFLKVLDGTTSFEEVARVVL